MGAHTVGGLSFRLRTPLAIICQLGNLNTDEDNSNINYINASIDIQTPSQHFCKNYIYCNKSTYSQTFTGNSYHSYHSFQKWLFLFSRLISESPFATWTSEQVQDWFRDEGLEEYTDACSKCVKKGEDLLKFTHAEYEKYLGISNPIHRKKLNLALKVCFTLKTYVKWFVFPTLD